MSSYYISWTQEKLDRATKLLIQGFTYSKVADVLSREYPNETFTAEKIRHQKRKGNLSIDAAKHLNKYVSEFNEEHNSNMDKFYLDDGLSNKTGENFEVIGNYAILDYRGEDNPKTL